MKSLAFARLGHRIAYSILFVLVYILESVYRIAYHGSLPRYFLIYEDLSLRPDFSYSSACFFVMGDNCECILPGQ